MGRRARWKSATLLPEDGRGKETRHACRRIQQASPSIPPGRVLHARADPDEFRDDKEAAQALLRTAASPPSPDRRSSSPGREKGCCASAPKDFDSLEETQTPAAFKPALCITLHLRNLRRLYPQICADKKFLLRNHRRRHHYISALSPIVVVRDHLPWRIDTGVPKPTG
jgi:hypothetical protein